MARINEQPGAGLPTYGWSRELTDKTRDMLESGEALGASFKSKKGQFGILRPAENGAYEITPYGSSGKLCFEDAEAVLKAGWAVD